MNPQFWQDSSVLITGGTGSFGKKCIEILLRDYHPAQDRRLQPRRVEAARDVTRGLRSPEPPVFPRRYSRRRSHEAGDAGHRLRHPRRRAETGPGLRVQSRRSGKDQRRRGAEHHRGGDRRRRQEGPRAEHRQGRQSRQSLRRHEALRREIAGAGQRLCGPGGNALQLHPLRQRARQPGQRRFRSFAPAAQRPDYRDRPPHDAVLVDAGARRPLRAGLHRATCAAARSSSPKSPA